MECSATLSRFSASGGVVYLVANHSDQTDDVRKGSILLKNSATRFHSQYPITRAFAGASRFNFPALIESLFRNNRPELFVEEFFNTIGQSETCSAV